MIVSIEYKGVVDMALLLWLK